MPSGEVQKSENAYCTEEYEPASLYGSYCESREVILISTALAFPAHLNRIPSSLTCRWKTFCSSADSLDYTEVPLRGASSLVSSHCPSLFMLFPDTVSHCVSEYQVTSVGCSKSVTYCMDKWLHFHRYVSTQLPNRLFTIACLFYSRSRLIFKLKINEVQTAKLSYYLSWISDTSPYIYMLRNNQFTIMQFVPDTIYRAQKDKYHAGRNGTLQ